MFCQCHSGSAYPSRDFQVKFHRDWQVGTPTPSQLEIINWSKLWFLLKGAVSSFGVHRVSRDATMPLLSQAVPPGPPGLGSPSSRPDRGVRPGRTEPAVSATVSVTVIVPVTRREGNTSNLKWAVADEDSESGYYPFVKKKGCPTFCSNQPLIHPHPCF